jgi:hypothetical protein
MYPKKHFLLRTESCIYSLYLYLWHDSYDGNTFLKALDTTFFNSRENVEKSAKPFTVCIRMNYKLVNKN